MIEHLLNASEAFEFLAHKWDNAVMGEKFARIRIHGCYCLGVCPSLNVMLTYGLIDPDVYSQCSEILHAHKPAGTTLFFFFFFFFFLLDMDGAKQRAELCRRLALHCNQR